MRRESITWAVLVAIVLAGFGSAVLILNATLYSASGFVQSYLEALARHDADGALELVGPSVAGDASDELLVPDAMGQLSSIHLISDTVDQNGRHSVVFGYAAGGVEGQTTFEVRRHGTLLGVFPTWRFASSPLAVVRLSILHDDAFSANGAQLLTPSQNRSVPYLVFAPGNYRFSHDSDYLHAEPIDVLIDESGTAQSAQLDIEATAAFVDRVQKEINTHLDGCILQKVLLPTGCPFGQEMGNRIVTTPLWSMTSYPRVTLVPSTRSSEWLMPTTNAAAHLVVDVKSLFDGSISTFDEDVPFSAAYAVVLLPDGGLSLTAQVD
jgi:hypothetical protein